MRRDEWVVVAAAFVAAMLVIVGLAMLGRVLDGPETSAMRCVWQTPATGEQVFICETKR